MKLVRRAKNMLRKPRHGASLVVRPPGKIRVIQRRVRDEECLRLKVLICMLPAL
jgi:hypothetical protein